MYTKAAEFWAELRVELLSASALFTSEKPSASQLWRLYWANHQVHIFLVCTENMLSMNLYFSMKFVHVSSSVVALL